MKGENLGIRTVAVGSIAWLDGTGGQQEDNDEKGITQIGRRENQKHRGATAEKRMSELPAKERGDECGEDDKRKECRCRSEKSQKEKWSR